jgi:hypothetical protein
VSGPLQTWEAAIDSAADAGEDSAHQLVISRGRQILADDGEDRRSRADAALVLYHCTPRYSFSSRFANVFGGMDDLETVETNVIRSCTNTKVNHVFRNKVRPLFVTEKGDSKLKAKALGMQRAVEGDFKRARIYGDIGYQVCLHGYLFTGGGLQISPDYANHRADVDLVRAHEFLVDPDEADRGNPRQGWRVRYMPRDVLAKKFSDNEKALEAIRDAGSNARPSHYAPTTGGTVADLVEVWEYWHLPSGYVEESAKEGEQPDRDENLPDPDNPDRVAIDSAGRHVICIQGFTLLDEPWPHEYFPIAWFKPYPAAVGWWSVGIPEQLWGPQAELNGLVKRINQIIKMHAVPKMIVDRKAKIKLSKFTNDVANIFETSANPTTSVYYLTPQSVPAELFQRVEDIIRRCREDMGLSEMSMYARKPAGVDHAPGMQMLADTETIRHTVDFRAWEDFHVQAARLFVDAYRLLAEKDDKFELVFADSKELKRIKWKEVDLENERFHLTIWPTNLLPQTPGAKMSMAMDLYNGGFLTREQTAMVLDYPDMQAVSGDTTAALENIERLMDDAKAGKPAAPAPYMNLALMLTTLVNAINRAEADGEPEEQVESLRNLWQLTNKMQASLVPPAPPGMPPAQGAAPMQQPPQLAAAPAPAA